MKALHFVYLSIIILIASISSVFLWPKERKYIPKDTRLFFDREYLSDREVIEDHSVEVSESAKYILYLRALEYEFNYDFSTFNRYLVVHAKDENTGEEKEICTTAFRLFSALEIESNQERQEIKSQLLQNKERRFQFKNPDALARINFYEEWIRFEIYTEEELNAFRKMINMDDVKSALFSHPFLNPVLHKSYSRLQLDSIKQADPELRHYSTFVDYKDSRKLAHIMFNHGIPMGYSSCFNEGPVFNLPKEKIWLDWMKQEMNYP